MVDEGGWSDHDTLILRRTGFFFLSFGGNGCSTYLGREIIYVHKRSDASAPGWVLSYGCVSLLLAGFCLC